MYSKTCRYLLFVTIHFSIWICGRGESLSSSGSLPKKTVQVEIITVSNIYSNVSLSNLPYIAPGIMFALDELRLKFGQRVNFTHTLLYDRRYTTCPLLTDNVDYLVADYYYNRRKKDADMTAFIGVGRGKNLINIVFFVTFCSEHLAYFFLVLWRM